MLKLIKSKLGWEECRIWYRESIDSFGNDLKIRETSDIEEEWLCLKTIVLKEARKVHGLKKLGNIKKKEEVHGGIQN